MPSLSGDDNGSGFGIRGTSATGSGVEAIGPLWAGVVVRSVPGDGARSLRTGKVIRPSFQLFSFPPRWYYDVLRALDHLRDSSAPPDPRAAEAIELVRSKRLKEGCWPLQNKHPGETHFDMEKPEKPSRWNTPRALRVLRWWGDPKGESRSV